MASNRVLVVEDVDIAQKMAMMVLENLGCDVDIAGDGREAIDMYQQNQYDMIFMDIGLPDTSGIEVAKIIRGLENKIHTPIVALTAHSDNDYKTASLSAGMNDFLVKPLTMAAAESMLKKFTQRG